jgi:hypothetical protein
MKSNTKLFFLLIVCAIWANIGWELGVISLAIFSFFLATEWLGKKLKIKNV